jgi:hypothetical protein
MLIGRSGGRLSRQNPQRHRKIEPGLPFSARWLSSPLSDAEKVAAVHYGGFHRAVLSLIALSGKSTTVIEGGPHTSFLDGVGVVPISDQVYVQAQSAPVVEYLWTQPRKQALKRWVIIP